jgi:hypothetical protein
MRTWIDEGRVSSDSLVWREGWRDWQVAGDVFPKLGADKDEPAVNVLGSQDAGGTGPLGKSRPSRSRRQETANQAVIITALILAVFLLVGVFIWVLFYYPSLSDESGRRPGVFRPPIAAVAGPSSAVVKPRFFGARQQVALLRQVAPGCQQSVPIPVKSNQTAEG